VNCGAHEVHLAIDGPRGELQRPKLLRSPWTVPSPIDDLPPNIGLIIERLITIWC
jgi:hypothetical protein